VIKWILTIGGLLGLAAASALTLEKIAVLKDPTHIPSCSIDPILSCGSVMRTPQAEVFGFPNPLLGLVGFAVVTTVGVVLFAKAELPQWFWIAFQAGTTLGVVFVHWLIIQSLYEIKALCPYCMVVWAVMIPIFWYTTLHVAKPKLLAKYHGVFLTVWYLVIGLGVLQAFWSYWTGGI
jgi:uncharacterized membrane protein